MFVNNFSPPWSKLPRCLYVSYRVCGSYITLLFSHTLPGYVFNNFFLLGQKLPRCLYVNYRICSSYITVLFSHRLSEYIFQQLFFKVTMVFVCKLSGLRCVYYHAIYTENYRGVFSTTFFPGKKVTMTFVCELSIPRCVIYHVIYLEFTGICLQQKFSLAQNYHGVYR